MKNKYIESQQVWLVVVDARVKKTRLPNLWHVIVHSNYLIILLRFQLSRYLMALILHMKSNASASAKETANDQPK